MPTYLFEAIDAATGKEIRDTVDAASEAEAQATIRSMGYMVTKLKVGKSKAGKAGGGKGKKPGRTFAIGGVKGKDLTLFTRQLSILQDAGLPILRSLKVLAEMQKPGRLKNSLLDVCDEIEGGSTLSEAMSKSPKAFDRLYCNMIRAGEAGLSFVQLDGNIGCLVNGAGLAMATLDLIKYFGGEPANFLDIGGSSNPQKVIDAMNLILSDKNVKVVMINIFGGITRCDDVARGLIIALDKIKVEVPIVVRLSGTNSKEGLEILKQANLPIVETMSQAAQKAIELCAKN